MLKLLRIAVALALVCFPFEALAFSQAGITPCTIAAQPGDLSFSASSANVHLNTCGETLIVINNSASDVRFRLGSASNTTALTTDLLLPKATQIMLNVGTGGLYFAVISAGSGTISFILGTSTQ